VKPRPFIERLRKGYAAPEAKWDIVETRLRLPRKVVRELKAIAAAEGISMNALVASFIDAGLRDRSRRSMDDLAPWFADYLTRTPPAGRHSDDRNDDKLDPDFT
jgi:hypothetical protein